MLITVNHVLTATTPDNTSYEIRPSHWNSVHTVVVGSIAGTDISGAFSNANNVSFGTNASGRITATASFGGTQAGIGISAGTNSATSGIVTFANSNGVTFGMDGFGQITATVQPAAAAGLSGIIIGAATATSQNIAFLNANGVSFGLDAASTSAITASINVGVAAGSQTYTAGTVVFSNSNNASFGMSNSSVITASFLQSNQSAGVYALGNSTSSASSGTVDARSISFNASGVVSVGYSNGSVIISAPNTTSYVPMSAGFSTGGNTTGTTGLATQQLILAGGANITLSGSTTGGSVTVSIIGGAGGGGAGNLAVSAGAGTSNTLTGITFANSNNITFGLSTGASAGTLTASYSQSADTVGWYAVGNTTNNSSTTLDARTMSLSVNGAGTFGFSNGSIQLSVPATSSLSGTGAVSLSTNGSTISIGVISNAVMSRYFWPECQLTGFGTQAAAGTLSVQYVPLLGTITGSRIDALAFWSGSSSATNATCAIALSAWAGISTRNASTLSSLSSGSTQTTYTYASNTAGVTALTNGAMRPISVPINFYMTPGEYLVGFNFSTATSSVGLTTTNYVQQLSMYGGGAIQSAVNYAEFTANTASSTSPYPGMGLFTAQTAGIPVSINLNAISQTGTAFSSANIALVFRNV